MGAATFLRKSFLIRWCLGSRESTRIREQTSGEDRGSSKGKGLGQGIPGKIKDHGGGEVGEGGRGAGGDGGGREAVRV